MLIFRIFFLFIFSLIGILIFFLLFLRDRRLIFFLFSGISTVFFSAHGTFVMASATVASAAAANGDPAGQRNTDK